MLRTCTFALVLFAVALWLSIAGVRADELLRNQGFEDGVMTPWYPDYGEAVVKDSPVHSAAAAVQLSGTAIGPHQFYQWLEVQPNQPHELSAWIWLDEACRDGSTGLTTGDEKLMYPIVEAVKTHASLGEVCGVMRDAFGEYRVPTAV